MKLSKSDSLFIFSIIFLLSALSFLLYADLQPQQIAGEGEPVGQVVSFRDSVLRKPSDRIVWHRVQKDTGLYRYDAVMTREMADAVIELKNGFRIKLEPDSMVEIDLIEDKVDIKLKGGNIEASGGGAIITTETGEVIELDDSAATVKVNYDTSRITAEKGNVKVKKKDGETAYLSENQILESNRGIYERKTPTIQLIAPATGLTILTSAKTAPVQFLWQKQNANTSLVISQSDSFNQSRTIPARQRMSLELNISQGTWYYKVVNDKGEFSKTVSFRVIHQPEIKPYYPSNKGEVLTRLSEADVHFRWSSLSLRVPVTFTLSKDKNFSEPLKSITTYNSDTLVKDLPTGKYYWKLEPDFGYRKTRNLVKMPVFSFEVKKQTRNRPVQLFTPDEKTFSRLQVNSGSAIIAWKAQKAAYKYRVEVVQVEPFEQEAFSGDQVNSFYKIPAEFSGSRYRYRVTPIYSGGEQGIESSYRSFLIKEVDSLSLLYPQSEANLYARAKELPLRFSWQNLGASINYRLEITVNKSSTENKQIATSKTAHSVSLAPGNYSFQVIAFDNSGKKLVASTIRNFKISENVSTPILRTPYRAEKISLHNKNNIPFKFQPVTGASFYKIKLIHKTAKSENVIYQTSTTKTSYLFKEIEKLKEGNLIIEVAAYRKWSGQDEYIGKPSRSEVNITYGPAPPAPEVIPEVITE